MIICFARFIQSFDRCSLNLASVTPFFVSGANTGIGKATATELAKRGARVVMGCRDQHKGEAVARMIRSKTKNPDVFSYQLDLASLSSIKGFVEDFNNRESSLHVLINNAGTGKWHQYFIQLFNIHARMHERISESLLAHFLTDRNL